LAGKNTENEGHGLTKLQQDLIQQVIHSIEDSGIVAQDQIQEAKKSLENIIKFSSSSQKTGTPTQ
jgi:hypothetical protein